MQTTINNQLDFITKPIPALDKLSQDELVPDWKRVEGETERAHVYHIIWQG